MYVDASDPSTMLKVSEIFSRTLAGLAMDDIYGTIYINEETFEEFDEEE